MSIDATRHEILLRTFDLPDIHFTSVSGLEEGGNTFAAFRSQGGEALDSIALGRWYEQSRLAAEAEARRDCWLQINDKIYVIWGALIRARNDVVGNEGAIEKWEFSFDEMRPYRPTPS